MLVEVLLEFYVLSLEQVFEELQLLFVEGLEAADCGRCWRGGGRGGDDCRRWWAWVVFGGWQLRLFGCWNRLFFGLLLTDYLDSFLRLFSLGLIMENLRSLSWFLRLSLLHILPNSRLVEIMVPANRKSLIIRFRINLKAPISILLLLTATLPGRSRRTPPLIHQYFLTHLVILILW